MSNDLFSDSDSCNSSDYERNHPIAQLIPLSDLVSTKSLDYDRRFNKYKVRVIKEYKKKDFLSKKKLKLKYPNQVNLPNTLTKKGRIMKRFYHTNKHLLEYKHLIIENDEDIDIFYDTAVKYYEEILGKYKPNKKSNKDKYYKLRYLLEVNHKLLKRKYYFNQERFMDNYNALSNISILLDIFDLYLKINFLLEAGSKVLKGIEFYVAKEDCLYTKVIEMTPININSNKKINISPDQYYFTYKNDKKKKVRSLCDKVRAGMVRSYIRKQRERDLSAENLMMIDYNKHDILLGSKTPFELKEYIANKKEYYKVFNKENKINKKNISMNHNYEVPTEELEYSGPLPMKGIDDFYPQSRSESGSCSDSSDISMPDKNDYLWICNKNLRKNMMLLDREKKKKHPLQYKSRQSKRLQYGYDSCLPDRYFNLLKNYKGVDGRKTRFKKKFKHCKQKVYNKKMDSSSYNMDMIPDIIEVEPISKYSQYKNLSKKLHPYRIPSRFEYSDPIFNHRKYISDKIYKNVRKNE